MWRSAAAVGLEPVPEALNNDRYLCNRTQKRAARTRRPISLPLIAAISPAARINPVQAAEVEAP